MARLSSVLIPSCDPAINIAALATTTASAIQTVGKNRMFAINADQDITIKFGNATPGVTDPTGVEYRIPANQQTTLDTGQAFDSFKLYNLSGSSTAHITIQLLSVV